jgi:hypothetical protein
MLVGRLLYKDSRMPSDALLTLVLVEARFPESTRKICVMFYSMKGLILASRFAKRSREATWILRFWSPISLHKASHTSPSFLFVPLNCWKTA